MFYLELFKCFSRALAEDTFMVQVGTIFSEIVGCSDGYYLNEAKKENNLRTHCRICESRKILLENSACIARRNTTHFLRFHLYTRYVISLYTLVY